MNAIFDWIAGIFKYPMQLFYNWTGSYLFALILFALMVRLIFIPMAIQQQKTQIKGAKLRPKIALIEKKYQGRKDPEALQQKQQEIMDLQQKEGYSPLSGCLPLLLQLPVLMGLYQVIRKPLTYMMNMSGDVLQKVIDYVNTQGGLTGFAEDHFKITDAEQLNLIHTIREHDLDISGITDITLPDMSLFGGAIDLSSTPSLSNFNWLLIIPLLTFVLSYLSMKVSRWVNPNLNSAAAANSPETQMSSRIMEWTMPLMGVWISFITPGAVGVYWLMGYVFSMIQTLILAKVMPLPTFTEEQIRQYEKEMKTSYAKSSRTYSDHLPPRRSLHHIDDDDAVDVPAPKKSTGKKSSHITSATQKKDERNND